ncbi:hypothetical protein RUM43_013908 [Polyplax serrata]|uniref:Uncharacterized protein n=1 Tax=Polyplax serrata TaxID=468196 RepID=A0AAN8S687_POLSC
MDTSTGAGEVETPKNNKAWCKLHLEKVLQEREKWIKVDDFDVSPGCPPGENFVADVFRVVVYGSRLCLGTWTEFLIVCFSMGSAPAAATEEIIS